MSLMNVFALSQSALVAQTTRLNFVAENLANAEVAAGSADTVYRAKYPVFKSFINQELSNSAAKGVRVDGVYEDETAPRKLFDPGHPLADETGFVYLSNVNTVEEMANMMEASRSYQTKVEMMNTAKQLLMRTLTLGQ